MICVVSKFMKCKSDSGICEPDITLSYMKLDSKLIQCELQNTINSSFIFTTCCLWMWEINSGAWSNSVIIHRMPRTTLVVPRSIPSRRQLLQVEIEHVTLVLVDLEENGVELKLLFDNDGNQLQLMELTFSASQSHVHWFETSQSYFWCLNQLWIHFCNPGSRNSHDAHCYLPCKCSQTCIQGGGGAHPAWDPSYCKWNGSGTMCSPRIFNAGTYGDCGMSYDKCSIGWLTSTKLEHSRSNSNKTNQLVLTKSK
jgi:hypothetical protein